MIYIGKAIKKVGINYVGKVIGGFIRRVYSVEKHGGQLIIDEYN